MRKFRLKAITFLSVILNFLFVASLLIWLIFERDGEPEPQEIARFRDFYLALECFDSLVEEAKNES